MNGKENNDDNYFTFPQESKIMGVFIFTFDEVISCCDE